MWCGSFCVFNNPYTLESIFDLYKHCSVHVLAKNDGEIYILENRWMKTVLYSDCTIPEVKGHLMNFMPAVLILAADAGVLVEKELAAA